MDSFFVCGSNSTRFVVELLVLFLLLLLLLSLSLSLLQCAIIKFYYYKVRVELWLGIEIFGIESYYCCRKFWFDAKESTRTNKILRWVNQRYDG